VTAVEGPAGGPALAGRSLAEMLGAAAAELAAGRPLRAAVWNHEREGWRLDGVPHPDGGYHGLIRRERDATLRRRSVQTLDGLDDAVLIWDPEGRLLHANERACRFLPGVRPEVGQTLAAIYAQGLESGALTPASPAQAALLDSSRPAVGDPARRVVFRAKGDRWFHFLEYALDDGCSVSIISERTERYQYEAELRQAIDAAEIANRAKSRFLANMSHELRTPLNAIIGFAELIRDETFGPLGDPHYREYARDIHEGGTHLLQLINDILDLSKVEAGKLVLQDEPLAARDAVGGAVRMMRERASRAGIELLHDLPPGLPLISADPRAVRQMLVNLISNAIKFTPFGGRIVVAAAPGPEGGLTLAVADTGIGIAEADMPQALAPFGQVTAPLNPQQPGTGLGLPLVKSLIEAHGGRLELASEPGAGTTVRLHFPPSRIIG